MIKIFEIATNYTTKFSTIQIIKIIIIINIKLCEIYQKGKVENIYVFTNNPLISYSQ